MLLIIYKKYRELEWKSTKIMIIQLYLLFMIMMYFELLCNLVKLNEK